MAYAPTCEQGVVYLFGRIAPRLGFHVEHVQVRYPDCLATRRGKTYRIEFEQCASHFAVHRHDPKGTDLIVCWENDWESRPAKYRKIEIIDLKQYVGALPRIFVVGCKDTDDSTVLDTRKFVEWNVPMAAQIGDLVLMYRVGAGASHIRDIWKVVGPYNKYKKRNRQKRWPGLQAGIKLVVRLKKPVTYAELARNRLTRDLGVVKRRFIGKTDITDDWHLLYGRIISKNPQAKKPLKNFIPD